MTRLRLSLLLLLFAPAAFASIAVTDDVITVPPATPGPPGGLAHPFVLMDPSGAPKATFGLGREVVVRGTSVFTGIPLFSYDLDLQQTGATSTFGFVLTADANGHAYVSDFSTSALFVYDASFHLTRTISLPAVPFGADVAPDGCTLWWLDVNAHVHRYDACANAPLPPPSAPAGSVNFVRALTGGGFVTGENSTLVFYDDSGNVVRTVPTPIAATGAAFSADGQSVWLAGFHLTRVPLSSGPPVSFSFASGSVAVVGEQRPTIAQVLAPMVPAFSPWMFIALAIVFAAIAIGTTRISTA